MATPLLPTFEGYIGSTIDALILFEACLSGHLNHVPRRPHDRERSDLIKSGYVFIYEEHASGIKRWTDGVSWSPSRILNNFLIYRELEKPFPPGEKKRALKKNKKPQLGISKPENTARTQGTWPGVDANGNPKDPERALIGSLVDSYPFKPAGLIKKTISITFHGVPHHMVSYYNVDDVTGGRLVTPSKHHQLSNVVPRTELLMNQNFRSPIDETECGDDRYGIQTMYPSVVDYNHPPPGSILQRAMSAPSFQAVQIPQHYAAAPQYAYQTHPHHLPPPQASQHQQQHPTYLSSMAPAPPAMPYPHSNQSNYSLDTSRGNNRYATGTTLAQEFPRNMPTQDTPRRHSTFDVGQPADMTPVPMMNNTYFMHPRPTLGSGQDHPFSSPRQVKGEPDTENSAPDQFGLEANKPYDLDESANGWAFDGIDASQALNGTQEEHYYPPNGPSNGSWTTH